MARPPIRLASPGEAESDSAEGENRRGKVWSIAQVHRSLRKLLDKTPTMYVRGEIVEFKRASSGHAYFSLKEKNAKLRCVMWNDACSLLRFKPEAGLDAIVHGRLSFYGGRGDLQFEADSLEPHGRGDLRIAFEQIRAKLEAEGLFDPGNKVPLPRFPETIGVVTSRSGAALRDVARTILRRDPGVTVVLAAARVQGPGAAFEIVKAIERLRDLERCDLIIVARGGGSEEELWSFNEEPVARAIASIPIPVVTGIGHEINVTIADLCADQRASTPTAAAECAVPERSGKLLAIRGLAHRQARAISTLLDRKRLRLLELSHAINRPSELFSENAQRLDELRMRLERGTHRTIKHRAARLARVSERLARNAPTARLARQKDALRLLNARAQHAIDAQMAAENARLGLAIGQLESLSPLAVLSRGYAVVRKDDAVLRASAQATPGDEIEIMLSRGRIRARVETVIEEEE